MIAKKIIVAAGLMFIMTFTFLSLQYLWYSVYFKTGDYALFCLFLLLILVVVHLLYQALNKFGWYRNLVNSILVLASCFLGMGALKIHIPEKRKKRKSIRARYEFLARSSLY